MPKRKMTKAEWQKVRPIELKKHGMGKALDAFRKACTDPKRMKSVVEVETASRIAAQLAAVAADALKNAPRDHAVFELLGDYIAIANQYRQSLDKEVRRRQEVLAGYTFWDIRRSKKIYEVFHAYCKRKVADENLDFLDSVDKSVKKEKIYKTFIAESAKRQINLDSDIVKELGGGADDFTDYASLDFSKAYDAIESLVAQGLALDFRREDDSLKECFGLL